MIEVRPVHVEAVERAMSSPAMRLVMSKCVQGPQSVRSLVELTHLPPASLYRHVAELQELGVLVVERSAMTPDGKAYDLYRSRLKEAKVSVKAERVDVTWEINERVEDRLATMWDRLGD
jgi:DNA-binding transcriptional ArsR family regulator